MQCGQKLDAWPATNSHASMGGDKSATSAVTALITDSLAATIVTESIDEMTDGVKKYERVWG